MFEWCFLGQCNYINLIHHVGFLEWSDVFLGKVIIAVGHPGAAVKIYVKPNNSVGW